MAAAEEAEAGNRSLEYTPTWIVAVVCSVIVFISLCAERALHHLGKLLKRRKQDALFDALQKLQEELMLLGFISLLLTGFQGAIIDICIPAHITYHMLPCKRPNVSESGSDTKNHEQVNNIRRHLLSSEGHSSHCTGGKVPLLSLEALHQLHIFIFVLALVHVIFCVTTMFLGGARIRQWKYWEDSIQREISQLQNDTTKVSNIHSQRDEFLEEHAQGYWRKAAIISWMIAFCKQFYGSVTKSDYRALRQGFIKEHCPTNPRFDFHKYMTRTLEVDFRKVVGISWYLWLFVVLFLLLNLEGWHTYFWLSFLPVILLLLVGAKLKHIITRLAQEQERKVVDHESQNRAQRRTPTRDHEIPSVKPSNEYFWFSRPTLVLNLIHFILFQNSFEIAFFFWIWTTYGFQSCIMEKLGYIITRLFMGVIVQVLCSYSTLPLYTIVTQMGSMFKKGMFSETVESALHLWVGDRTKKETTASSNESRGENA